MSTRRRLLAALAAGLLLPFAFAPYGVWPAAPIALAVLLFLLEGLAPRPAAWTGWCFGLGMFGHGVSWIQVSVHQFGVPYYLFSVTVTLIFVAGMAGYTALFAWLLRSLAPTRRDMLLVAPGLWVVLEIMRGWFLTGFPWLSLGYSQTDAPLVGFAPLGGVFLVSLACALAAAFLWLALRASTTSGRLIPLALLAALFAAGLALERVVFTEADGERLDAALIQGAIPQALKWRPDLRVPSIELYRELSASHWGADIVVWPETAIPAFPHEVETILDDLRAESRRAGSTLVIGMPTGEPWAGTYFNSVVNLETGDSYEKRHLVPFGEFFPLKEQVAGIARLLSIPMSDFSAGAASTSALDVAGRPAGISICYEDAFGEEVSDALPQAAFLINVSNDAWFGRSLAPHQHLQIARMRAIETGRDFLRATNNGITAIIDHRGRITGRAEQFAETSLVGSIQPRRGATPYARAGRAPALLLSLALISAGVFARRRRADPAPAPGQ